MQQRGELRGIDQIRSKARQPHDLPKLKLQLRHSVSLKSTERKR
jgi:hypothetical protein